MRSEKRANFSLDNIKRLLHGFSPFTQGSQERMRLFRFLLATAALKKSKEGHVSIPVPTTAYWIRSDRSPATPTTPRIEPRPATRPWAATTYTRIFSTRIFSGAQVPDIPDPRRMPVSACRAVPARAEASCIGPRGCNCHWSPPTATDREVRRWGTDTDDPCALNSVMTGFGQLKERITA
jgi:hypothetical protein